MGYICLGLSLAICFIFSNSASASSLPWPEVLLRQEEYVVYLQHKSGCLTMTPFDARINPYFNNLALWGIVDNPEYNETIRKWADWYINHLNRPDKFAVHGSIYDYMLIGTDSVAPTEDYDSSDSYAATFLSLMRRYYDTNHDEAFLLSLEPALSLIVDAIYATMDPTDKLTYAKMNYRLKYLMDNIEVFNGLDDWAYLLQHVYNKPDTALKIREDAHLCKQSLQKMWNGKNFAYAKDEAGKLFTSYSDKFYPDMTAQLMAIALEFATPEQAKIIWFEFNKHFPQWTHLGHPDSFPWTIMAYTAAKIGDWEKTIAYLESVESSYSSIHYRYPWYAAEAGWYLQTLRLMPESYLLKNWE